MANGTSQALSSSLKRDQLRSVGVDIDFEDLLVAAIASVLIKSPKKRKFASPTPTLKFRSRPKV